MIQSYSRPTLKESGAMNQRVFNWIAGCAKALASMGSKVALVSSGAVYCGRIEDRELNRAIFGLEKRATKDGSLEDQITCLRQSAASIGQPILMSHWRKAFDPLVTEQILLDDQTLKIGVERVKCSFERGGVIPVINANDAVITSGVRELSVCADNDRLARLIAEGLDAILLVIITTAGGLRDRDGRIITYVDLESSLEVGKFSKSQYGTGGIESKIAEARAFARGGGIVLITDADYLGKCLMGEVDKGTWIYSLSALKAKGRKHWDTNIQNRLVACAKRRLEKAERVSVRDY